MAKKQTRRSISVSRSTYERLKAFCEANNISMSQLVETQVNGFLGDGAVATPVPTQPAVTASPPRPTGAPQRVSLAPSAPPRVFAETPRAVAPPQQPSPMTAQAARIAIDPPPPIIKSKQQEAAPKPAEKRAEQIFTF